MKADFIKNKSNASELIAKVAEKYALYYNVSLKKISIRDQKTRWGSCSRLGNLNFSYKLLYLPQKLREYVIVHEICHLKEFNHSAKFWALVAHVFPDFKTCHTALRKINIRRLKSNV